MASFRSSAAYRIAFTYAAAFALAILLLGAAVYVAADAQFRHQRDRDIAEEIAELADKKNRAKMLDEIAEHQRQRSSQSFIYALFDPRTGRQVGGAYKMLMPQPGFGMVTFFDPDEGRDMARAQTIDVAYGDRLTIGIDSETVETIDATILGLFAAACAAVLAISLAGALLLGRYLRARLAVIGGTARAIVAGNLDVRVPVSPRGDEFDKTGLAVNAMLDRIGQLMENLRQVSSDVAHDLRTPLLRLRGQLERIADDPGAVAGAIAEGDKLMALFGAILRISEVEGGALARGFAPVDLTALVDDIGESCQPALADAGHLLRWTAAPGITVAGDRELLAQAMINLLDNCRTHTPPGTQVMMTLARQGATGVTIAVTDNGPGVPPGEHDRIVRRFARSERSRSTPGYGLGLSLASAIAIAHGGRLTVADNQPGLSVTIELAALEPAAT